MDWSGQYRPGPVAIPPPHTESEMHNVDIKKPVTISGRVFQVIAPFRAGMILDGNQAHALNQTFLENIRNNSAAKVAKGEWTQGDIETYALSYNFDGMGGGRVVNPVAKRMREYGERDARLDWKRVHRNMSGFIKTAKTDAVRATVAAHWETYLNKALRAVAVDLDCAESDLVKPTLAEIGAVDDESEAAAAPAEEKKTKKKK